MNNKPYPDRRLLKAAIDDNKVLAAIALELARIHICDQFKDTVPCLSDNIAQLAGEIARLRDVLTEERLTSANLLAAIHAALGAAADGEANPFAYLRDELPEESGGAYGT